MERDRQSRSGRAKEGYLDNYVGFAGKGTFRGGDAVAGEVRCKGDRPKLGLRRVVGRRGPRREALRFIDRTTHRQRGRGMIRRWRTRRLRAEAERDHPESYGSKGSKQVHFRTQ